MSDGIRDLVEDIIRDVSNDMAAELVVILRCCLSLYILCLSNKQTIKQTNKQTNEQTQTQTHTDTDTHTHTNKNLEGGEAGEGGGEGCCLFVGCLTSQQHAGISQGRICTDNFTCCHTEVEVADQTLYLTQSQYMDTGPTSPSADPIAPGTWQGSHWSANL